MTFYIVITVISAVALTADMILRYMENMRSFGMDEPLHNIKGKIIPVEEFLPNDLTMLCVSALTLGVVGIILKLFDINGLVAFPCALLSGSLMNFLIVHFIKPYIGRASHKALTKDIDISGEKAVCTEKIEKDGYGRIKLIYKEKDYYFDAVSANETDIHKGERVYILYHEDNVCSVEKETEIISDEYFKI